MPLPLGIVRRLFCFSVYTQCF